MNVVFVGECGTGKSSLINLVIGRDVAKTSNDTAACTTQVRSYNASIDGYNYKLWDTPGLNEGSTTRTNTRSLEALIKSFHHIRDRGEIQLLVYCMHGNRAKVAHLKTYEAIRDSLPPTVSMVAVVTRLERYQGRMEDWWSNNAQELLVHGMSFADHACITTVPDCHGLSPSFRERLVCSRKAVRQMIYRNCPPQSSFVRFPVTSIPNVAARGEKNHEYIGSQSTNVQTTPHRVRATMRIRRIPTPLFA